MYKCVDCGQKKNSNRPRCFSCAQKERFTRLDIWNKGKQTGQIPWNYKGEMVGYRGLHRWITLKKGKANHCENCDSNKKRMYHWANISGLYKRELEDWIQLCVPCHKRLDKTKERAALLFLIKNGQLVERRIF